MGYRFSLKEYNTENWMSSLKQSILSTTGIGKTSLFNLINDQFEMSRLFQKSKVRFHLFLKFNESDRSPNLFHYLYKESYDAY